MSTGTSSTTVNGDTTIDPQYRSTPIAETNKNAFVIKNVFNGYLTLDDAPKKDYKDTDGEDTSKKAIDKTKHALKPTVGSIENPSGHILKQLKSVDPQHLTSFLPNAVDNIMKIKDLNAFSSTGGISNILGQMLGQAFSSIGLPDVSNLLSQLPLDQLSSASQDTLNTTSNYIKYQYHVNPATGLIDISFNANSPVIQQVIDSLLPLLIDEVKALIASGSFNVATLDALIIDFLKMIESQGSDATVGVNQSNVLDNLSTALPQLADPINGTMNIHLPPSVLDISTITDALQKFAMSQTYIKKPTNGKKDLAKAATQPDSSGTNSDFWNLLANGGSSNILGQMLGQVFNNMDTSTVDDALSQLSSDQLSSTSQQVLNTSKQYFNINNIVDPTAGTMKITFNATSDKLAKLIQSLLPDLYSQVQDLIASGNFNQDTFNSLNKSFITMIEAIGNGS